MEKIPMVRHTIFDSLDWFMPNKEDIFLLKIMNISSKLSRNSLIKKKKRPPNLSLVEGIYMYVKHLYDVTRDYM